jgi:hypothetical protein
MEQKVPIHMVLTDVVMPGMSGPQLADQLIHLHPKMKVLFIKMCQNTPQLCWGDEWHSLSPGGRELGRFDSQPR